MGASHLGLMQLQQLHKERGTSQWTVLAPLWKTAEYPSQTQAQPNAASGATASTRPDKHGHTQGNFTRDRTFY
jgi:hypothetical protein